MIRRISISWVRTPKAARPWLMLAALVAGGAGCVDGTTPDCSDAASGCSPDFDAYPADGAPVDSAPQETGSDAGGEPQPEAGPEGGRDAGAG